MSCLRGSGVPLAYSGGMSGPPDTVPSGAQGHKENPVAETFEGEAYCVKCKEKRAVKDGRVEVNDKGRRMAKGTCGTCGTKVTVFLKAS